MCKIAKILAIAGALWLSTASASASVKRSLVACWLKILLPLPAMD
jgi:hypothetical protein